MHTLFSYIINYFNEPAPTRSGRLVDFSSTAHALKVPLDICAPFSRVTIFFVVLALWRKSVSSCCSNCARETKYSWITCDKGVCVRSECSISEDNEETIGWQANKRVGYCRECAARGEKIHEDFQNDVGNKGDCEG